jgi:ubiquinone/menaquinone biosynthesis C-methylase UbiE
MAAVAGVAPGSFALDIGGGPGMHAGLWAAAGVSSVVVDPARAMLARAVENGGVIGVAARAQQLPFRTGSCAVAYFHLSIHYGDWRRSLDEAWRVLAPGGRLVVWTLGEDHHRQAMLIRYFPQLLPIDLQRFPDPDDVVRHLDGLGAEPRTTRQVDHKSMAAGRWEAAVRARFVSTLQHLSDAELEQGLARFGCEHPDPGEELRYRLLFTGISATR